MAGNPTVDLKEQGLSEIRQALKGIEGDAQDRLHAVLKEAAQIWQREARSNTPVKTGRAAKSIRVVFAGDTGTLTGGGNKVPYFRWLDYGGWVGKAPMKRRANSTEWQRRRFAEGQNKRRSGGQGSVYRKFERKGRIIYPAYFAKYDEVMDVLNDGLRKLATDYGLDVSSGG